MIGEFQFPWFASAMGTSDYKILPKEEILDCLPINLSSRQLNSPGKLGLRTSQFELRINLAI